MFVFEPFFQQRALFSCHQNIFELCFDQWHDGSLRCRKKWKNKMMLLVLSRTVCKNFTRKMMFVFFLFMCTALQRVWKLLLSTCSDFLASGREKSTTVVWCYFCYCILLPGRSLLSSQKDRRGAWIKLWTSRYNSQGNFSPTRYLCCSSAKDGLRDFATSKRQIIVLSQYTGPTIFCWTTFFFVSWLELQREK